MIPKETGEKLKTLTKEYKAAYTGVYRCIKAARFVSDDLFGTVFNPDVIDKLKKRAKGIIKREILSAKRKPDVLGSDGKEIRRFLSAFSPKGVVFLSDTVYTLCNKIYELNDTYGIAPFLVGPIKNAALAAGYNVIACYCPLNPEHKLDHIIIPALSLGFITVHSATESMQSPYRRIHLDSYLSPDTLKLNKQRLKFMRRTCNSLLDEAVEDLRAAKNLHDEIEELYNPAINFEALYKAADALGQKLRKRYLQ